jgi:hypothetical protein
MNNPNILIYNLNYYKPQLDKAIKLTEQYVADNKLILTGGMAIDLALREKHTSIYSDDELPDYDILSDQNVYHAHELAKLLCENGLPEINVINASHITTVRVRIRRDVLLDATYIPSTIFNKIPYLDTGHLRVVHPHYQFIDQRSSLGMLMLDKGITLNVFNRLKKDIERNDLLRYHYPIQPTKVDLKYSPISVPLKYIRLDNDELQQIDPEAFIYTGPCCITGYAAFHLYMNKLDPKNYPVSVVNDNLEIPCPSNLRFSMLSYDIDKMKELLRNPKTYRQLLSLKPISMRDDRYELIDTYGTRMSCFIFKLPNGDKICVSSTDYILSEFLRDRIFVSPEPYTMFYTKLIEIVSDMRTKEDADDIWMPTVNCYGFDNLPEYRAFNIERILYPEQARSLKPRNEYLRGECLIRDETFDTVGSHYFRIDGTQDDTIEHTNFKHMMAEYDAFLKNKRTDD